MISRYVLLGVLLAGLLSQTTFAQVQETGSDAARADHGKRSDVSAGAYFVGFKAGVAQDEGIAAVRNLGAQITTQFPEVRAAAIRVAADAAAQAIARNPRVAYVEPIPTRYAVGLEDSQLAPSLGNGLYGLITTRVTDTHAQGVSGAGINIGVADTGLDYNHPDIAPNYRGGIDTVDHDNDPIWEMGFDEDWGWWLVETHGTHVAGTLMAADNSVGVLGVVDSANLYHARVLSWWGGGTAETVMDGVRWLVDTAHCKVVNLSLGGQLPSTTEENFYQEMRGRGVLIVCAAGNESATSLIYPAAYPSNIGVGAVDVNNQHASFSNTGNNLDVSAPGVSVLSSVPPGWGFQECWVQTTQTLQGNPLEFASTTDGITRPIINCELGQIGEFPPSAAGNIALIQRGGSTFAEKVTNATNAGAVAAIIYNHIAGNFQGTLGTEGEWIPTVSVSDTDGAILVSQAGSTVTVVNRFSSWDLYSGTSMATPHVTGVLALVWSVNPLASSIGVENSLLTTCLDLGPAGYDTTFGHGLVDAYAAVAKAQSAGPPPPAPTGLMATGGHWQVSLSWNPTPGADSYIVQRTTASGGPYHLVSQVTGTAFIDYPLLSGKTYYYTVAANNSAGASPNSSQASAATTGPPPPTGSSFQGLSALLGGGIYWAYPYALSGDSSTIVGYGASVSGYEAFRWTSAGGMQGLSDLSGGDFYSTAYGVSAEGSVIVGAGTSVSGTEAFRWTSVGGMQGLGDLSGGVFESTSLGVSGDGSTIVGYGTSNQGRQAIRRTTVGGMQGLGDFGGGGFDSIAYGVSGNGSTIVGYGTSNQGKQAFRWTSGGGMQGLGDLAGGDFESIAYAVSADGSVIVGYGTSASGQEAFRWTSGGMQGLGDLAGGDFNSRALAVSGDGSTIVGYGTTDLGSEAFLWDAVNGMRNLREVLAYDYGLDLTGWMLQEARGISADGRTMVGSGLYSYSYYAGWIATLGTGLSCSTFVAPDPDRDCDVDLDDVGAFHACSTGPALGPPAPGCELLDFDNDLDIDQSDFGFMQRCFSGAGIPVDSVCAD